MRSQHTKLFGNNTVFQLCPPLSWEVLPGFLVGTLQLRRKSSRIQASYSIQPPLDISHCSTSNCRKPTGKLSGFIPMEGTQAMGMQTWDYHPTWRLKARRRRLCGMWKSWSTAFSTVEAGQIPRRLQGMKRRKKVCRCWESWSGKLHNLSISCPPSLDVAFRYFFRSCVQCPCPWKKSDASLWIDTASSNQGPNIPSADLC